MKKPISTLKRASASEFAKRNILILLISILATLLVPKGVLAITQNQLFWVLSTVAQSFVALVAFLGMVGIFRLQQIRNEKEKWAESIRPALRIRLHSNAEYYSTEEALRAGQKILLDGEGPNSFEYLILNKIIPTLKTCLNNETEIRVRILNFFAHTIFLIFVALALLVFIPQPTHYFYQMLALFYMGFGSFSCLTLSLRLANAML